jgi:hypothetical protein
VQPLEALAQAGVGGAIDCRHQDMPHEHGGDGCRSHHRGKDGVAVPPKQGGRSRRGNHERVGPGKGSPQSLSRSLRRQGREQERGKAERIQRHATEQQGRAQDSQGQHHGVAPSSVLAVPMAWLNWGRR